jgi:hypothetical protein
MSMSYRTRRTAGGICLLLILTLSGLLLMLTMTSPRHPQPRLPDYPPPSTPRLVMLEPPPDNNPAPVICLDAMVTPMQQHHLVRRWMFAFFPMCAPT